MTEHNKQYQHEVKEAIAVETAETAGTEQAELTHKELQARVAELGGQLESSKSRGSADEQNLCRRYQQEIVDTYKFVGQKFAAEMSLVKDYLGIALPGQSGNFDVSKMDVQMTLDELQKALDTTHIKEINPQPGDKLDSHQHQAMQAVVNEQEPNTIVSVMKKGYTLAGRVLRPAMAVVVKKED